VYEKSRWQTAGLIFGFYTLLTLLFLPQVYFYSTESANAPPLFSYAWRIAVAHYLWALLTLLIFRLGNRLPVERPNLFRNLLLHLFFSLVFSAFHTIAYHYILGFISGAPPSRINFGLFGSLAIFLNNVTNGFIIYAGSLAYNQAAIYSRKYRDREFRLQQAELEVLKMQLHPHFLFNTLNAISALVYASPQNATKTISQLSDLLRLTLNSNKTQEVALKDELNFLRKYIQIQQTLLQERLEIEWKIDAETLDAAIPNMLLQPLVENSIRHGIAPIETGGRIEIETYRDGKKLFICVKDNGLGLAPDKKENGNGVGLVNTQARLRHLYEDAHEFYLTEPADGGLLVKIVIPFREKKPVN
jgi:two-component system, LytTR family, sensor kinase